MKFQVHFQRDIAEQSANELTEIVEADSVEDAIIAACNNRLGRDPKEGDKVSVYASVVVGKKTKLNLRDVTR